METEPDPLFVMSCVEVAVIVAVPVSDDVNTPELVTVPMLEGLADHVTDVLKLPVPVTVDVQVDVCVDRMDVGEQLTETDVTVVVGVGVPPLFSPPPPQPVTIAKAPAVASRMTDFSTFRLTSPNRTLLYIRWPRLYFLTGLQAGLSLTL
jgi:hypothetical protein